MLSLQAPRERGRLLKLRAFHILFETLAAGGRSLLRSELFVKASGLSKPQKCPVGRLRALGGLSWRMQKYLCLFGFDPRVVQSQAGPSEAPALC